LFPFGLQGGNVELQYRQFFGVRFGTGYVAAFEINIEGFSIVFAFAAKFDAEVTFRVGEGFRQEAALFVFQLFCRYLMECLLDGSSGL
jgi:hypothetical protein